MAKYKCGQEARVGDVVLCEVDKYCCVSSGKQYEVVAIVSGEMALARVNSGFVHYDAYDFTLVRRAAERPIDQQLIAAKFDALKELCLRKNADYGSTFARPPCLAPGVKASDAVLVRMSDKIGRLESLRSGKSAQVDESIADTVSDLSVYGILYLLAREKEDA